MDLFNSPAFKARVDELIQKHHVPGISIAIVQNDTISSAGWGLASIDPPQKTTPDTLYNIASCSKSLTAASVGLLVADESLPDVKWETPMSKILPEDFVLPTREATEGVTVEDVLSHRTGMAPCGDSYFGINAKQPDTAKSVTRNLRNLPMAAPLRSKFIYNNMMYTAATHLVEEVAKLPFADYLEQKFFQPLGMESSNLQPARARAKGLGDRIATGYIWDKKAGTYRESPYKDSPETNGAGGIVTSVNDYIKWVRAMMNQQGPITEDMYQGLVKSRIVSDPDHTNLLPFTTPCFIGAGWEVIYYRGHRIVQHDGGAAGVSTHHFFLPEFKFGGCIFGNCETSFDVERIVLWGLIDEVLNIPANDRLDWAQLFKDMDGTSEDDKGDEKKDGKVDKREEERQKIRQALCPGIKEPQPLTLPLTTFVGKYWNAGFKQFQVQIKDSKLFIDATDRSFPFTMTLHHVCDDSKFLVELTTLLDGNVYPFKGEFVVEDGEAVRMGLHIEASVEEYIRFDVMP